MQWIERIESVDGRLYALYADRNGNRRHGGLSAIRGAMPRSTRQAASVTSYPLHAMRLVDSREYLDAVGLSGVVPDGHQVFELHTEERRILIPAAVGLLGLIGNLAAVGHHLMEPVSLDRIAVPLIRGKELGLGFHKLTRLHRENNSAGLSPRYAWLTSYPSARELWHSVYKHGMTGVLGFTPPRAFVDATFYGRVVGGAVIATRMSVSSLVPDEKRLPFAASQGPYRFAFHGRGETAAENLGAFRASGAPHPTVARQGDIPMGPDGYRMSMEEWEQAYKRLKGAGFSPRFDAKSTLDLSLEKYGGGIPWSALGPKAETATVVVKQWKRRGQWDAFKEILRDIRSDDVGRKDSR